MITDLIHNESRHLTGLTGFRDVLAVCKLRLRGNVPVSTAKSEGQTYVYHHANRSSVVIGRSAAHVALQHRLGILSKRWIGSSLDYCAGACFNGPGLRPISGDPVPPAGYSVGYGPYGSLAGVFG